jgi:acyl carrier protein phosphodiesterase
LTSVHSYLEYIVSVNYLAHAYLSFEHPEILTGNMISDYVKGKKKYEYSPGVLAGINYHRAIDTFTDEHPVTKSAKQIFKPVYGLYSSAFMDVVYDHFLAKSLADDRKNDFSAFTKRVYGQLDRFNEVFPPPFSALFPYMKRQDWLYNYQFSWGIANSFEGLVRRAAYLTNSDDAFILFEKNYHDLQAWYTIFFPALREFSLNTFNEIVKEI